MYAACATVAWCAALNALWLAFTLLGGVLLGVGPATLAACTLARRRMAGESVTARDFARTWRAGLLPGTVLILPVLALVAILGENYLFFSALGPRGVAPRLLISGALLVALGAGAYVAPMYAHYTLPLHQYLPTAVRFALARPASTVLLLLVFAALAYASLAMPVLLATVSVGGWLQASTWLCVRFFAENENRLAEAAEAGPPASRPIFPTEPLRMR